MSYPTIKDRDLSTMHGNILLLGPSMDSRSEDACFDHLRGPELSAPAVLWVGLNRGPERWLDKWRDWYPSTYPLKIGLVYWDSEPNLDQLSDDLTGHADVTVTTVPNPGNLTQLGVAITTILGDWEDLADRIVVCFRSVTTLLQYVEVQSAYKFLNEVSRQVESVGATAHYHLDPVAHDQQTVRTLASLFEQTISIDPIDHET